MYKHIIGTEGTLTHPKAFKNQGDVVKVLEASAGGEFTSTKGNIIDSTDLTFVNQEGKILVGNAPTYVVKRESGIPWDTITHTKTVGTLDEYNGGMAVSDMIARHAEQKAVREAEYQAQKGR